MRRLTQVLACALLASALGCDSKSSKHEPQSECAAVPAAPTSLAVADKSTSTLVLEWTPPAEPANCSLSGYSVYDGDTLVGTPESNSFTLEGLASNTPHTLTVSALNAFGSSEKSAALAAATLPDLGPNTHIYSPDMAAADIQADIDGVFGPQYSDVTGQFNTNRYALLFKPGHYTVNVPVGYYMQVLGLGALPDDVQITGRVHSEGHWSGTHSDAGGSGYNATQNFWRGLENFSVVPTPNNGTLSTVDGQPEGGAPDDGKTYMRWAVSQACPFRRMHVKGDLAVSPGDGWSSGGWMSDAKVDGVVNSGSQQQWITRNSSIGSWSGVNWNHVFLGVDHPYRDLFEAGWASVRTTIFDTTPSVREKPFLHVDAGGDYHVYVPSLQTSTTGISWANGQTPGTDLSILDFFVAKPGDAVADINAALAAGKHLLLTPGIYHLNGTIEVTAPNTVVLGIGMATLHPDTGLPAMTIADVDGVTLAGVLFDAGADNSPVLLKVGEEGASADHHGNPTVLADVFMRIGGAEAGKATAGMIINSRNVIGDHFWIWRADHGTAAAPTGWAVNTSTNGLIVNASDVTIYGLFVEHFEGYQTLWNGERGRVYFYQSEIPYDVPDQASWMAGSVNGYASYKVASAVTDHQAWGLGVYSVFNVFDGILDNAIEVPVATDVKMHHMVTFGLAKGIINHVINGEGGPATSGATSSLGGWQQGVVVEYPVPPPVVLPDPAALVFPLSFEAAPNARYGFLGWGDGLQYGIIHDPDNAANHVLGFKRTGGNSWAGFSIDGGDASHWLASNPFNTSKRFTLKVKCDTTSVPFLLKFENPANSGQSVQVAATSAEANTWQTLTFDFTGVALTAGVPYTRLDLFPGYDGSAAKDAFCYTDDLGQVTP